MLYRTSNHFEQDCHEYSPMSVKQALEFHIHVQSFTRLNRGSAKNSGQIEPKINHSNTAQSVKSMMHYV